jgi:glycosyltransferase involved in cell wall biosynthesis
VPWARFRWGVSCDGRIWERDLLRLVYFSLDYTPHDHRFLSALAETEHEVFYVRLQRGARQVEDRPVPGRIQQVHWAGGQREFRWRDLPRLRSGFRRLTRDIRPDLVHAGPIQTCAFIAALSGVHPLLTMSWGFDLMQDAERNRWWRYATRYTLRRSDFFTSDAAVTRERALEYGMNPERTVVFPWGVDLAVFATNGRSQAAHSSFTLLCNRAWEPRYGVDVLARAFVKVGQQRPDVDLLLLGGGSQGAAIRQIIERGGVGERVTFAGQVSQKELPRYYHMADLFVSPSHIDGSSVSLMEALACGLPCLVSDIPANCEWVHDGENGWLFPDGDADALAAKILSAVAKRESLEALGRNARATAEAKADWSRNFADLLQAYQQIVSHA